MRPSRIVGSNGGEVQSRGIARVLDVVVAVDHHRRRVLRARAQLADDERRAARRVDQLGTSRRRRRTRCSAHSAACAQRRLVARAGRDRRDPQPVERLVEQAQPLVITASVSPAVDRVALGDRQLGDLARLVGGDLVLHLHRLDDADQRALLDVGALLDEHLEDVALHRRGERVAAAAAAAGLALALAASAFAARRRGAVGRGRLAVHGDARSACRRPRRRSRGRRSRPRPRRPLGRRRGERLEPLLVLDQVAAGLAPWPTARRP